MGYDAGGNVVATSLEMGVEMKEPRGLVRWSGRRTGRLGRGVSEA